MDTKWCHPNICIGTGKYPRCDPWGRPFTAQYHPHRMRLAGKRIAGNYVGVLEAFRGDQDFIRILFSPSRCIAAFLGNYKYVGFIRFAPHHYIADFPKKSFNHQTMQPRFFFQAILLLLLQGMSMGLSGWQPPAEWLLVHKFWTSCCTPQYEPWCPNWNLFWVSIFHAILLQCFPRKRYGTNKFFLWNHGGIFGFRNSQCIKIPLDVLNVRLQGFGTNTNRFPNLICERPCRLVTISEWADVNPETPLMRIPGWSPWRFLAPKTIGRFVVHLTSIGWSYQPEI